MKKIKWLTPLFLLPTAVLPITSCKNKSTDKVMLSAYTDASVVGVDGKDFWLSAEPAATVRSKVANLNRVGNVQSLYGQNGFNQAVLVCKKSVWDNNSVYLNKVKQCLDENQGFISNPDNLDTIIDLINANQTKGRSSVLTKNNTTTDSLINCNAKQIATATDVISYVDFLEKAISIDSSIQRPSSPIDFYKGFPNSSTTSEGSYKIICPDGSPAVGIAKLISSKDSLPNSTSFELIEPGNIMARITLDKPELAVLPSNLATRLFNEYNHEYVWLSTVTWGNLYILSKNSDVILSKDNLASQLKGKSMGVLQLYSVPGLVLKIILKDNNISYEE